MRIREIDKGLFRATRRATNVYLADRGGHGVLIDTGEPDFAPLIEQALGPHPPARQILLTHAHYDHAGSAAILSEILGADVFAAPADAELLRSGAWRRIAAPAPDLIGRLATRFVADHFPDRVQAVRDIRSIVSPEDIAWADARLITLPGHSAGQSGFGLPIACGNVAWMIGDAIMTVPWIREPVLYENRQLGLASIRLLADLIRPGDLICPGHGMPARVTDKIIDRLRKISAR